MFTGRFALGISSPEARAILAIAPTPAAAAKLSVSRIAAALRRAGRSRNIDPTAVELKAALRKPQLHQHILVESAMGRQTLALLAALDTACASVVDLGQARRRCEHGDRHAAANRHLFNKLLGQLYHCLQQSTPFDEGKAFAQTVDAAA